MIGQHLCLSLSLVNTVVKPAYLLLARRPDPIQERESQLLPAELVCPTSRSVSGRISV